MSLSRRLCHGRYKAFGVLDLQVTSKTTFPTAREPGPGAHPTGTDRGSRFTSVNIVDACGLDH